MQKIVWIPGTRLDPYRFRSGCARFRIGLHTAVVGYYALADVLANRTFTCRSVASAKAMARDILAGKVTAR